MENREGYTVELRSVIRLVLEVACYCILAVAATLAIAGIRTSLEPTANPLAQNGKEHLAAKPLRRHIEQHNAMVE